jgi:hypothetical protein
MHYGIDWNVEPQTKLVSVCNGTVVHAGYPAPFSHGPKRSKKHSPLRQQKKEKRKEKKLNTSILKMFFFSLHFLSQCCDSL